MIWWCYDDDMMMIWWYGMIWWWWWYDIWYDKWYDIWYDMIWHDDHMIWYDDDYIIWSLYFCCRHPSCPPSSSSSVRPSVPSVRRRRPSSSSSSVRPSVPSVRRRPSSSPYLQIQGRMQIFKKLIKIEVPRPRDYAHRVERKQLLFETGLKIAVGVLKVGFLEKQVFG